MCIGDPRLTASASIESWYGVLDPNVPPQVRRYNKWFPVKVEISERNAAPQHLYYRQVVWFAS
jgi:hypothetical protein